MKTFDKTDNLNLKYSNQLKNDNQDNVSSKLSVYNEELNLKPKNRDSSFYLYDFESKSIQWSQSMYQSCDNSILTIKPLLTLSSSSSSSASPAATTATTAAAAIAAAVISAAPKISPDIMSLGSYPPTPGGVVDLPQEQEPDKFCFKFLLERLPCYKDDEYNINQHIKNYKGNVQDGDIFI